MIPTYRIVTVPLNDCCGQQPNAEVIEGCMDIHTIIKCTKCGKTVYEWCMYGDDMNSEIIAAEKWNSDEKVKA